MLFIWNILKSFFSQIWTEILLGSVIQSNLSKASLKSFRMCVHRQDPLFFSVISEKETMREQDFIKPPARPVSTSFRLLLLPCETRTSVHPRDSSFVSKIPSDLLPRWLALLPRRDGVMACNEKKKRRITRRDIWGSVGIVLVQEEEEAGGKRVGGGEARIV